MTDATAITLTEQALREVVYLAGPMMGIGLVVGLFVSVFQATTQINEPTLSFVPKLAALVVALVVLGHWMLHSLVDFTSQMILHLPTWVGTGSSGPGGLG